MKENEKKEKVKIHKYSLENNNNYYKDLDLMILKGYLK
jgi:hypothetical protein